MRVLNRIAGALGLEPKRETRARESFTDQQIVLISAAARGNDDVATATAAIEVASGMYARDLALAEVSPKNSRTAAITPTWLALCGRELARCGQFVCDIEIVSGEVKLRPAAFAYATQGNVDPSSWIWTLNMYGPGYARTRTRPNSAIVNVSIGSTVSRPWAGRAPWQAAHLSSGMLSGIERQLSGEARSKSGYILPTPDLGDRSQGPNDDGETDPLTKLREDLAMAAGRTLLAPSMASGYGGGPGVAPSLSNEYQSRRFGINPPTAVAELRRDIERSVLASYGILPATLDPKSSGTALREARRQWHVGVVVPTATLIETALSESLNEDVKLNMRRGKATDSATMARAISSLTSSGMSLEDAIVAVGL